MEQDLQQQIEKRLAELPQDVREAIQSAQVQEHLREIAQKHKLHIDQSGKLEDEVYMVMLGFADPAELSQNLAESLTLPAAEAVALATDVTNEIFMPIRASMQRWAEERGVPAKTESKPAPQEVAPAPKIPVTPPSVPVTPAPKPAPDLMAADAVLSEKKVSMPPLAQSTTSDTKPQNYKADPYREPIE